ncbi:MAG: hypothetical protein WCS20_08025 [Alphaproteobacteria bacterium]
MTDARKLPAETGIDPLKWPKPSLAMAMKAAAIRPYPIGYNGRDVIEVGFVHGHIVCMMSVCQIMTELGFDASSGFLRPVWLTPPIWPADESPQISRAATR